MPFMLGHTSVFTVTWYAYMAECMLEHTGHEIEEKRETEPGNEDELLL